MDIKNMTLDMKIGQMIMAGFESKVYDVHLRTLIEENNIGNVLLFSRNIGDTAQMVSLVSNIQENMMDNIGIPAFIAVDQEGGTVTRIHEGVTVFPGNMALSASCIKEVTLKQGKIVGEELRNLGINLVLAPVLDVNNNPSNPVIGVRSYGDNPEQVSILGTALIKGIQSKGVIATAKHFPGHGDTEIDSHVDLPVVDHDMERLMNVELFPFIKAINEDVGIVMSAHILFPAIEKEKLPGTLSYRVLTELLRENLGFKGIIITDCMEMKAISETYGTENASVMAIKAGADIICISHSLELQIDSHKAIKEAVLRGELSESRIDESVKRILDKKTKYNLFKKPYPDEDKIKNFNGCTQNKNFAQNISEKSIVVLQDNKKLIPVNGKVISISTNAVVLTGAENEFKKGITFCEAVKDMFGGESFTISLDPDKKTIEGIVNACKDADRVVIGTYNAFANSGQTQLVNAIENINKNIIVIALRSPYDLSLFKEVSTLMCTFEYNSLSVSSVLKILSGKIKASGKIPVDIL